MRLCTVTPRKPHPPLNERTLAAVQAAWSRGDVVVFRVLGLDPLGVKAVYENVQTHLAAGRGAIHVSYPTLPARDSPAEARTIDCVSTRPEGPPSGWK